MNLDYLGLPGLRTILPVEENDFSVWVKAEQFPKLASCPECGCADETQFILNGTRPQIVRHEPRGLRRCYVEVQRQSYSCKQCQSITQHPLPAISSRWRATHELVSYVEKKALLRPQREVALLTGLPTKTVREIAVTHWDHLDATVRFETPRVLGLDGVYARVEEDDNQTNQPGGEVACKNNGTSKHKKKKTVKRQCVCVTDIEKGIAIELWPSAKKDDLVKYLKELPNRERIKIVLIDMSNVLYSAVKEALPWAIIVIDLFHVLCKANVGMDKVRQRLRRKTRRVKGHLIMCKREMLRKHRDPHKPGKVPAELGQWFDRFPELRLAYEVKEAFFEILHSSTKKTAVARKRGWLEKFPLELRKDFAQLLSSLRDWEDEIFNYFDHRFTNAFTEARNRLVKDILRETRGCYFKTLRARLLYGSPLKREMEEALREEMARKKRKPQPKGAKKPCSRKGKGSAEEAGTEIPPALPPTPWQLPSSQMSLF
jgi:transposase